MNRQFTEVIKPHDLEICVETSRNQIYNMSFYFYQVVKP